MSRRVVRRIGFFCLFTVLAICIGAVSVTPRLLAQSKTTLKRDKSVYLEIYTDLMSRMIVDESELADELALDLLLYSKLLPPAEDFYTSLDAGVLPYDPVTFPSWIFANADVASVNGVTAYELRLLIDFKTWETRVEDAFSGTLLWKVQPPYDFSMESLVRAIWGDAIFDDALTDSVLRAYSPSRLAIRYVLISRLDVADYVTAFTTEMGQIDPVSSASWAKRLFSAPLRVGGSNDWEITGIETVGSDLQLTFTTPTNWVSTNTIDIFSSEALIPYWWGLAGSTNGTNSVTWTDTATSGVDMRFYCVADGETDTDSDGTTDAHETLAAHSDPDDEDSYPVNISGTITHSNTPQSGTIYIMAVTNQSSWDPSEWRHAELSSPGAYTNDNVATLHSYWFRAFRDWRANGIVDPWEATGTYSTVSTAVTSALTNIDIDLTDPVASIAGFLTYTGRQEGVIRAIASTSDNWSTNTQDVIASFNEEYVIESLSQTSYYVKAWIDADEDGIMDSDREAFGTWTNNPISLTNSIWDIDMTLEDIDDDGDDMPDWWEIEHFGNTNQAAAADYDADQMPNDYEYEQNFNPTNAADAMNDADNDGYPNVYEYKHDSDPWNISEAPGETGGDPETPTPSVVVVTNGSIQAGLDAATNGYDIVRVDPGTYTGSTNCNLSFPSHPVLLIAKEAATNTIIDCQSSDRAITFSGQSNHTAVVQLSLINGSSTFGGAICIMSNAHPVIWNCVISNCVADLDGGGIYCTNANVTLKETTISGCTAHDDGGALRAKASDVTISDSSLTSNHAVGNGGAVYVDDSSSLSAISSRFSENTSGDKGGGIAIKESALDLYGCAVTRNICDEDGGGISLVSASNTSLTVSYITANRACDDGGGIRCKDSSPVLKSCVVAANLALYNGGGLYLTTTSSPTLWNCTVFTNMAAHGSGGGIYAADFASAPVSTNCIVWANSSSNIFSSSFSASYSAVQNWSGGTSNLTSAPLVIPDSWLLCSTSPCIDVGTNGTWAVGNTDIEGQDRTNGTIDVGADEYTDTDDDAMSDAWEVLYFGSLTSSDGTGDSDSDGISDADEYAAGTSPTAVLSNDSPVQLAISFGDNSHSESELYSLHISNSVSGVFSQTNTYAGSLAHTSYSFERGEEYTIWLEHEETLSTASNYPSADYDYEFWISWCADSSGWHFGYAGDGFIVDNTNGVLGRHVTSGITASFDASNEVIRLYMLDVDMVKPENVYDGGTIPVGYYQLHSFGAETTPTCSVACAVKILPDVPAVREQLAGEVAWSIGAVTGSTLTWLDNATYDGTTAVYMSTPAWWEAIAKYTGMPSQNSSFGKKTARCNIDAFSFSCNGIAKVFFQRDEKNHPGVDSGVTPNWYYYWINGDVVAGLSNMTYAGDSTTTLGGFVAPSTLNIYMGAAHSAPAVSVTNTWWTSGTNNPPVYDDGATEKWVGPLSLRPEFTLSAKQGIYLCRSVVQHESKHKELYESLNGGGQVDTADGDTCPDILEGTSAGDPYYFSDWAKDTYRWQDIDLIYWDRGDNEMLARIAGNVVSTNDVEPEKDWSDTNGCNWHHNY